MILQGKKFQPHYSCYIPVSTHDQGKKARIVANGINP
jgi:hypothetical protein